MKYSSGLEAFKLASIGFGGIFAVALLLSNLNAGSNSESRSHFRVIYPERLSQITKSDDPHPCAAENAALAIAIANLDAARKAAEEAYIDWVDCMEANGLNPNPEPEPPPRTVSILESDR